ncbi:hypothetical protein RRG08_036502 [Elysia crispata]|uniref:CUB domain-containing protein n=1 Tax=Elysia crispata TaxID=231223 RepID=A0AAE0ZK19_9GAST|nr:hypothetical protein RRG08_036502 [Elysia crispata]
MIIFLSPQMRCCLGSLIVFMAGLLHNCTPINPEPQPHPQFCIDYEGDYHIVHACDCVVYQSHGGNQGRFNSPDFPTPYPPNKNCILYTFIGEPEEIIKLEFIEFNFKMPDPSGRCVDFLRVYNTIDRPEVNEFNKHDMEFCGSYPSIQNTVYSSSRSLVLEFHSDYRRGVPGNYTGFKGVYQFLDRRKYITTGQRLEGKHCTYEFYSNATHKKGRFFSPFYPQNYKPNGTCRYNFHALPGERVRIVFKNVQLHDTASSCRDSPDVIKVYDGLDRSANVIGHLCGIHNDEEVVSTGTNLYVAFTCDDKNQKQGFAATYEFTSNKGSSTINDSGTSIHASTNREFQNKTILLVCLASVRTEGGKLSSSTSILLQIQKHFEKLCTQDTTMIMVENELEKF